MAPLKTSLSQALRSHLSTKNARVFRKATHPLAGTTRNVASTGMPSRHTPSVFVPQDFLHLAHHGAQAAPSPRNSNPFDTLLNNITAHLTSTPPDSLSPQLPHLFSLLRSYETNSSHWAKYAHANPAKQYTRNLVCSVPGVFNLLLLVWTPGKGSPVHDHADAHCLMKILKGSVRETRFAVPRFPGREGPLKETNKVDYRIGKVAYMADSLGLHSIANPHPTEYAVSLHLYTPPHAATRGCHVYDEGDGTATHVEGCTYDSVQGAVSNS